jgi:hypothetical protein
MIWHWLNVEIWGPMWPNMFAPSAITLAAIAVSHVKRSRQARRHHEDLKAHVTATQRAAKTTKPGRGQ